MHFTGFAFLKTYQKEKKNEKKKLDIYQTSFQLSSPTSRPTVPFYSSSEQLTQLRISFLQDEVPFECYFKLRVNFSTYFKTSFNLLLS